jgi:nitrogenase molybdenum-iron protein alpha chain
MAFIEDKVVTRREERLQASNVFGGSVCQLVRDSKRGCLVNKNRSFTQTSNCQLGLALTIAMTMPDTVLVVHAPVGCGSTLLGSDGYYKTGLTARGIKAKPLLWVSTNLSETDVINGGETKLEETILKVDAAYRPASIIVLTTCTPGIIGDDVDEIVARVQKQVAAKVILSHCEGFKTKISATGYDAVYHGIARSLDMEREAERKILGDEVQLEKERFEKSRTVNVFNVYSTGRTDELELQRLLEALNLKVRFFPNFAPAEAFQEVTNAALNVSICATHDDYFLKFLQERYGVPYLIKTMPLGIKSTGEWLLDVAERFHLEEKAQRLIQVETEALEKKIEPFRAKLKGKRVFVSGGEIRVAVTALVMKELGCELVGVRGHHYDPFGDDIYARLIDENPKLDVNIATTQVFELVNLLNRIKPDLFLGHSGSNVWAGKVGIPSLPIFNQNQFYMGYKGVYEIGRRAVKTLENTAFSRNLHQNLRLPFKADWYERNPFTYIRESQS